MWKCKSFTGVHWGKDREKCEIINWVMWVFDEATILKVFL